MAHRELKRSPTEPSGMIMTTMPAIYAIPYVVAAPPGIVTYNDLLLPLPADPWRRSACRRSRTDCHHRRTRAQAQSRELSGDKLLANPSTKEACHGAWTY